MGCGDTFLGGFLAGLQRGMPARDALAQATVVAAASAMSDLPASFSQQDVENLSPGVQVRRLSH